MDDEKIFVTSPLMPQLEDFYEYLKDIWDRKWITNNGYYHCELEKALSQYLGVQYISLFTNGTLPLVTALQAMGIKGEVITTPYSFVATTHSLWWNKIKPVFVDIDPNSFNIDPIGSKRPLHLKQPRYWRFMFMVIHATPREYKR